MQVGLALVNLFEDELVEPARVNGAAAKVGQLDEMCQVLERRANIAADGDALSDSERNVDKGTLTPHSTALIGTRDNQSSVV